MWQSDNSSLERIFYREKAPQNSHDLSSLPLFIFVGLVESLADLLTSFLPLQATSVSALYSGICSVRMKSVYATCSM